MNIPTEIAEKYNLLKKGTYDQVGLDMTDPCKNLDKLYFAENLEGTESNIFSNVTLKKFVEYISELLLCL